MNLLDFVNKEDLSLLPDGLETKYVFKDWFKDTFLYESKETMTHIFIEHPYYYSVLRHTMTLRQLITIKANDQKIKTLKSTMTPYDIVKRMLELGHSCVPCMVDSLPLKFSDMNKSTLIKKVQTDSRGNTVFVSTSGYYWNYGYPFDNKTHKQIISYINDDNILLGDYE